MISDGSIDFYLLRTEPRIEATKKLHAATLVSHRVFLRSFSASETDDKIRRRQSQPSQARFVEENLSPDEI